MSKTVQGLLNHCQIALKNNVQYIYGAKMKVMSLAEIKALQNIYGTSYVWKSDLSKANKLCCDCSGLISSYTGIVRNSTDYKNTALQSVTIAELKKNWKKYVGWGLWMKGHIGVVSDKEGYYYAMDGSARNMVHNPMHLQGWTLCIKLKDIDYSNLIPKAEIPQIIGIATENLNIRKAASTQSAILGQIPKNKNADIIGIAENGWYKVSYKDIVGYCSNSYLSTSIAGGNIKNAINKLVYYKVISSPDYWIAHYDSLPYLELMIVRSAICINKEKINNAINSLEDALNKMVNKKIITDPTYWMLKTNKIQFLKQLILNIANAL